jgi:enoyl-CoA hydratase
MLFVALSRSTFRHASSSTRFSTNFRAQREYANVLVSWPSPGMALITLNRPKALNAVHFQDISDAMKGADEDASVGAMILTESERAFAGRFLSQSDHELDWTCSCKAGVDIKEMKDKSCEYLSLVIQYFLRKFPEFVEAYTANFLANWEVIPKLKKPVIAAVSYCNFIRVLSFSSAVAWNLHCRLIFLSQRLQHILASQKSTSESSLAAGPNASHVSLVNCVPWNSYSPGV